MTPEYTVFYANKLFGEGSGFRFSVTVPDGAYVRVTCNGRWYRIQSRDWEKIALHDMPPEMQAIALIYFT